MVNILACVGGRANRGLPPAGRFAVAASHYDTKRFQQFRFVGANDGGSSTGALLELARALAADPPPLPVVLAFLDGEEACHEWSETDSLYGSRHLAREMVAARPPGGHRGLRAPGHDRRPRPPRATGLPQLVAGKPGVARSLPPRLRLRLLDRAGLPHRR